MGYDAACTLRIDGKAHKGTAWLEHKDLVFRGPLRVSIPLKDITSARADGGALRVVFGSREAEFVVGAVAAKWVQRILNPPSTLDKLGVKAGRRVLLVGTFDPEFKADLQARGGVVVRRADATRAQVDVIFYEARTRDALDELPMLVATMRPDAALWVVRPKGQRAITETDTMAAGKRAGLVDVKVVSFSDTLTAEKFVIPVAKRAGHARPAPSPRRRESPSSRGRT